MRPIIWAALGILAWSAARRAYWRWWVEGSPPWTKGARALRRAERAIVDGGER